MKLLTTISINNNKMGANEDGSSIWAHTLGELMELGDSIIEGAEWNHKGLNFIAVEGLVDPDAFRAALMSINDKTNIFYGVKDNLWRIYPLDTSKPNRVEEQKKQDVYEMIRSFTNVGTPRQIARNVYSEYRDSMYESAREQLQELGFDSEAYGRAIKKVQLHIGNIFVDVGTYKK